MTAAQEEALLEQTIKKKARKGGRAPKAPKQFLEKVLSINEALLARNNLFTKNSEVKVDAIYKALNNLLLYAFQCNQDSIL